MGDLMIKKDGKTHISVGFDKYKDCALELLKLTVNILNEFNIDNMLISGTLLGYIRHNDFIPWDDDIDLLGDSKLIDNLQKIYDKYKDQIGIINIDNYLINFFFKSKGIKINNDIFNDKKINKDDDYMWPFVDVFVYGKTKENLIFFNKKWEINEFFPLIKTKFLNIDVFIPKNSHYFLENNYDKNYMIPQIKIYLHKLG